MRAHLVSLLGSFVLLTQLGCSCGPPSLASDAGHANSVVDPLVEPLEELQAESASPTFLQLEAGGLTAAIGQWKTTGADRIARAKSFVEAHRPLLQLDDRLSLDVRRSGELTLPDGTVAERVVFHQRYRGLPVEGAELTIIAQGENITGVLSRMGTAALDLDPQPALSGDEALAIVRPTLPDPNVQEWAAPALVVFDPRLTAPTSRGAPKLAWRLSLGDEQYYVDAKTGEVLSTETNVPEGMVLFVDDEKVKPHKLWVTGTCNAPAVCTQGVYNLLHHFQTVYDWYKSELSWVSFDDANTLMVAQSFETVTGYATSNNASLFTFSRGAETLDIVGHEFTHSVVGSTSQLRYKDEPGAVNESLADLFGNLIQGDLPPGEVGEQSGKGTLRNMCRPRLHNQPDTYDSFSPTADDHGGVHRNSGIGNRAWCSVVERRVAHGQSAAGARRSVALTAFIGNLFLNTSATYQELRGSVLWAAATTVVGQPDPASYVCDFVEAFDEVAISGGGDGITSVCHQPSKDRDGDGVSDAIDNCPDVRNPSQLNTDDDDNGDACDPDIDNDFLYNETDLCPYDAYGLNEMICAADLDNDAYLNKYDNCPKIPNQDQKDSDHDGTGDACETDGDEDGVDDNNDTCPFLANPNQKDSDHDGLGDACDRCPAADDDFSGWTAGDPTKGLAPKPLVPDSDHDGTPDACDSTPNGWIDAAATIHAGGGAQVIEGTGSPFAALDPCSSDCSSFDESHFTILQLAELTPGAQVVVADDHGRKVARTDSEGAARLQFRPRGGTTYRVYVIPPPGGSDARAVVTPVDGPKASTNPSDVCLGVEAGGACSLAGGPGRCLGGLCTPAPTDSGVDGGGETLDAGVPAPTYSSCEGPTSISAGVAWAVEPDVAIDGLGHAVAAWREYDGAPTYSIRAARFSPASGWSAPVKVADARATGLSPHVAVNQVGDAIISWLDTGAPRAFWTARWNSTTSAWGAPVNLLADTTSVVSSGSLALDASGNAWACFLQGIAGTQVVAVWAAHQLAGSTWQAPTRINGAAGLAESPTMALNGSGQGLFAWVDASATPSDIRASFLAPSGAISEPVTVDTHSGTAIDPVVAINAAGDGVITWRQVTSGATSTWDIGAARFSHGTVQSSGPIWLAGNGSTATSQRAAIDATGRVAVAWRQTSGAAFRAMVAFDEGAGWKAPVPFDVRADGAPDAIGLWLTPNGQGLGVFDDGAIGGAGLSSTGALATPRILVTGNAPRAALGADAAALLVFTVAAAGPSHVAATWCR